MKPVTTSFKRPYLRKQGRKAPTTRAQKPLVDALNKLSKAALIDCLLDLLGHLEGAKPEQLSYNQVRLALNARLQIRGDRLL